MKRSKKMLLLLAALVLCVGGYLGAQLLTAQTAVVTEESGSFALESHTADELTSLAWQSGEESFAFTCASGTWSVTADPAFPLNQEDVQTMAAELLAIVGNRQLDGVTDLSAYGLAEPAFTVTATWSDGSATTWAMGDETPFADGYYISLGHENIVYTTADDISAIFDTTLNDLAVLETLPTASSVTRLTVGDTLDVAQAGTSRTINAGETWYDSLTGAALDASSVESLVSAAQAIAWADLAEPTASDEELASFGVDEASATAITLYDGDTAAMTLLIGGQDDSGAYYARLPGSTMVYTVKASSLSALLSASADAMPSMVIIDLPADSVQTASFTTGAAAHTWVASNGEDAEDEADHDELGETLWDSILDLSASSRIDAASATGDALLTVEVAALDGQSATLTFTSYDASSYAVTVLDRCFLVDAADVDAIIRTLRAGVN